MSGELHEISAAIGELRAGQKQIVDELARIAESRSIIHAKIDALSEKVGAMAAAIAAHSAVDDAVAARVTGLEKESDKSKEFRLKALGGLTVIAAVTGALGSKLATFAHAIIK